MSESENALPNIQNSEPVKTIREILGLDPDVYVAPEMVKTVLPAIHLPVPPPPGAQVQMPAAFPELPEVPAPLKSRQSFFTWEVLRYPLIFVVALGFFYVLLNFRAVGTKVANLFQRAPEEPAEQISSTPVPAEYNTWMEKYYVFVNDRELLQAGADPDRDGLSNVDEFYVGTNPLRDDTDEDSYDDGTEIIDGYNPLYAGKLTIAQQQFIAEHLKLEEIAARRDYNRVAGTDTAGRPQVADERRFTVDTSAPGNLAIPRLGVDAPVIWTRDFVQMEEDLKYGVAHHPATPFPGEPGTASIHGHSSGYPWDGNYKNAFTRINELQAGDEVFVQVFGTDGTNRRYRYTVQSKKIYAVNDPAQFADLGGSHLNLSTSWPLGTAQKRMVVTTNFEGM